VLERALAVAQMSLDNGTLTEPERDAAAVALESAFEPVLAGVRDPAMTVSHEKLVELCETAINLEDTRMQLERTHLEDRLRALGGVQEALSRLRGIDSVAEMVRGATRELCRSCGFDRAVLFRVEGSEMVAESVYFKGNPEWAQEFLDLARYARPQLDHMLLETEMLRRRAPMLVPDARNDPRTFKPLVEASRTHSYVAAPVMPEGRVIGFLHADRYTSERDVDEFDRDTLWTFAEGFGYAVERTILLERLEAQSADVMRMVERTEVMVRAYRDADVDLPDRDGRRDPSGVVIDLVAPAAIAREQRAVSLLTRREQEVLELMAEGATNAEIADRLVIAPGTVKSHVKHILRKLRAANRAEAVSRYLRLSPDSFDSRDRGKRAAR
jgi:DNA-binding CsgD family transcriptional regulator